MSKDLKFAAARQDAQEVSTIQPHAPMPTGDGQPLRSDRRTPLVLWLVLLVAFAGAIADVLMMKSVLDRSSGSEVISWLLSITIGMLCFGTALSAGIALKEHKWIAAGSLMVAWAALGGVLFYLRYNTAAMTRPPIAQNASDAVKAAAEQQYAKNAASDHVMAWLLLAVFVLVGVAVIADMHKLWQPDLWAANRARKHAAPLHDELMQAEAQLVREEYQLHVQALKEKMIGEDLANQYESNAHRGSALRQSARQRIIEYSGEQSATGLGRAPHVEHITTEPAPA